MHHCWRLGLTFVALGPFLGADSLSGQLVRDIVFTGGVSAERYEGNLPAVALPVVDSTELAHAATGEVGARGSLRLLSLPDQTVEVRFDAGLRQFSATGFRLRAYAPREWVGRTEVSWNRSLGSTALLRTYVEGAWRRVEDRTPVPLFIEPGYRELRGGVQVAGAVREAIQLSAALTAESTDFESLALLPQLDLLDRQSVGVEVAGEWGTTRRTRVFTSLRRFQYPEQGSFRPDDPYRRDLTLQAGALWTLEGPIYAEFGLDGTANRSNSDRPEYDALTARALLAAPLPGGVGLQLYGGVTGKRYVTSTPFARLVPGEEADNASLLYAQISRPLADNLDGAVRFGWTRAETEIGASYFQRFGTSVLLNFRPWRR